MAGSFPLDMVIAAAMPSGQSSSLGAVKAVRMLKLMRVSRFMNKLHKIK